MSKLLKEAFSELIKTRKWYKHSLRSAIQAKNDKASFIKTGKLSEEQIRDYLSAAGWICVQAEYWNKPGLNLKEAFNELIKTRKWYVHSSRSPIQAKNDKTKFLLGKTVEEKYIREYLLSAGYTMLQEELWEKI